MTVNTIKTTDRAAETAGPITGKPQAPGMMARRDFDRLFDSFLAAPFGRLLDADPFRRLTAYADLAPRIDVRETEQTFEVTAELPGVDEKDIDLTVGDRLLTMKAEKKEESEQTEGSWHMAERRYGTISRSLRLPETVDEERISAQFDKGVLRLTLPKRPMAEKAAKKIEVTAARP